MLNQVPAGSHYGYASPIIRRAAKLTCIGALAALLASVLLGACGGGSSSTPQHQKLRAIAATFPDSLDPALSVTLEGWTAMWNTYLPLLTYAHAERRRRRRS